MGNRDYSLYANKNLIRLFEGAPLEIVWFGFRGDTHSLFRQGWTILADEWKDELHYSHCIQLGVRSPDGKMLITGRATFSMHDIMPGGPFMGEHYSGLPIVERLFRHRPLEMTCYTAGDTVRTMPADDFNHLNNLKAFNPFEPCYEAIDEITAGGWARLKIFDYTPVNNPKSIFIPQENVEDYLDKILKLQYPEQQEIKKKLINPSEEKLQVVKAQIITLAA